ncbi:hypothetical protein D922_00034 [Enterococcus faecalis 06-MB-DW-09]|nr:hypothetical protein D922_00034 [Enterococcus faecalis 06-MB-DW-09]
MPKKQEEQKDAIKKQDEVVNIPEEKQAENPMDKQLFVNRKLAVINKKTGALQERNAARIVKNNK